MCISLNETHLKYERSACSRTFNVDKETFLINHRGFSFYAMKLWETVELQTISEGGGGPRSISFEVLINTFEHLNNKQLNGLIP